MSDSRIFCDVIARDLTFLCQQVLSSISFVVTRSRRRFLFHNLTCNSFTLFPLKFAGSCGMMTLPVLGFVIGGRTWIIFDLVHMLLNISNFFDLISFSVLWLDVEVIIVRSFILWHSKQCFLLHRVNHVLKRDINICVCYAFFVSNHRVVSGLQLINRSVKMSRLHGHLLYRIISEHPSGLYTNRLLSIVNSFWLNGRKLSQISSGGLPNWREHGGGLHIDKTSSHDRTVILGFLLSSKYFDRRRIWFRAHRWRSLQRRNLGRREQIDILTYAELVWVYRR